MKRSIALFFLLSIFLSNSSANAQGTWTRVAATAPDYNHGVMLLLTDGTILAKTSAGNDANGDTWDRLTPDIHGSYAHGTWVRSAQMQDTRLYFSTQVLKNGCVYVAGGEYGTGRTAGEVYYPDLDVWIEAPALPLPTDTFSDANSEILPDGRILQAVVISGRSTSLHTYIYDPTANTYAVGPPTHGSDNESAWLKLPDNSILYVDIFTTHSERYIPATNTWVTDASLPVELYDPYGFETGAAFLLPDGRGFFIGSSNKTAYYTPSGNSSPGTWTAGPAIPDSLGAPDAAAAMMVNGKILCAFSHTPTSDTGIFLKPMVFYEFNYLTDSFTKILAPGGVDSTYAPSYFSNMVCLPDGTLLYASQGDDQYYIYTPDGSPLPAGKPAISNIIVNNCDTFLATGTLFNGITEGAAYGDDWQMATNYPIIRLSTNDTVYSATTYNWTSTGVSRGTAADTVQFVLPAGIPAENYSPQVIANGNASDPVPFIGCFNLGVSNISKTNGGINVYPNPASGIATVVFDAKDAGGYNIRLMDVYGRVIKENNGTATRGQNTYTQPLNGIPEGIYTIMLRDGTGVYNTKLIVK